MKKPSNFLFFAFHFSLFAFYLQPTFSQSRSEKFRMILHDDWRMQSSRTDSSLTGAQISQKDFPVNSWYKITVPSTIIGGLLANNEYKFDPFYSKNFEKLADDRLDHPWWFRKEFPLPASEKNKNVILKLHGINYKANVWLNGLLIADSSYIKGPFRIIELDITKQIKYMERMCWRSKFSVPLIQTKRRRSCDRLCRLDPLSA